MVEFKAKHEAGVSSSPIGSPGGIEMNETKVNKINFSSTKFKIGTWNVRSMLQAGKIHNTIREMVRLNIDVMGISEMRWPGTGECCIDDHTIYYIGKQQREQYGVGLIVNKRVKSSIISILPHSNRVILLKLLGKPNNINLIQVYAPTSDKSDDEIEEFYNQLNNVLKHTKNIETTLIIGDFNAKVGQGKEDNIVGSFGLGQRNPRGDRLVQFCREEEFVITNTWFDLPPRRLYTWKAPGDKTVHIIRNQIDFILVKCRWRNCVTSVKTYPGADVPSDHNLLIGNIKIRLKKTRIKEKKCIYDPSLLKEEQTRTKASNMLEEELREFPPPSSDPEKDWEKMKQSLNKIKDRFLKCEHKKQKKKQWMTDEILEMMDTRRQVKNLDPDKYWIIHKDIRRKIREAKEIWLNEQCKEIEDLNKKHDVFNVHKKIKEISHKNKQCFAGNINDEQGNLVIETEEKIKVWHSYIKKLFQDDNRPEKPVLEVNGRLEIMPDEVKRAIQLAKNRKSPGPDNIPIEILKIMEEDSIGTLTALYNYVYNTGIIPKDWLTSTFITLPKKPNAKECKDFRTISLMSHVMKIFLKIIHARIYKKCEENIGETQFGFRNGLGTREALFMTQVLIQRCRDMNCDVYLCFIDYKKAFDRCQHGKMIEILREARIDQRDIRIISNLYWEQKAAVRVDNNISETVEIRRGVRQGCILSPLLFNLYSEAIFREALDDVRHGIKANGELVNNIRYADDTVVLADSLGGLQDLMDRIVRTSLAYGLDINIDKTKYMVISKLPILQTVLQINNLPIERVSRFTYLGCILNENWDHSQEIKSRIEKARAIFTSMKPMFCCRELSLILKSRMLQCYVFSTLLYGVEAWTLTAAMEKKVQAFEMWLYRRILRISWTDRVPNNEVLQRMQCEPELMKTIKQRKLEYFGHIMRHEKYRLLQVAIQGKVEGVRGPGRRRISWLANLRKWFNQTSVGLFRVAANKVKLAMMVANVRKG